ncbi:MAG: ribosomal RNA small subunit methyltransferase A [Proteobacteria bacterium]|nr:ribosomal RNA small subunit methyltransferase A [Pseudomonadota bacterium]
MTYPGILLKAWQLGPKKQLGQNFLTDPSVSEMIVRKSGITDQDHVVEIGPGLGALTIPLLKKAKKVYAIEKDTSLIPVLRAEVLAENIPIEKLDIQNRNVLDVNFFEFEGGASGKIVIIGNLPYNISSQILIKLMQSRQTVRKAIFMFQKELAQRIVAAPGGKDYGRLSVALQYCSVIRKIAEVRANLFFPKPKVDSEVIEIVFKDAPEDLVNNEDFFLKVIKAGFGRRRKTLRNSLLGSELDISSDKAIRALEKSGIDPVRRAETLTVKEFVMLSNFLEEELTGISDGLLKT